MKKIIIIGGKGNGTLALSTIININKVSSTWEVLGFLNDREIEPIAGYPVLGKVEKNVVQEYLKDEDVYFYYALISVKLNFKFLPKLYNLEIPTERFATLVDPSCVIADDVKIGYGTIVMAQTCISAFSEIGNFVQILPQSFLGTQAKIENFGYLAPKAYVGAYSTLHEGAYMGPASTIIEFKSMGKWSLAGMGSIIIRDVPDFTKVVGNPSHVIGKVE